MIQRRSLLAALGAAPLLAGAFGLSGCALLRPGGGAGRTQGERRWSGRLSLRVENDPRQSFSAGFELRGSPQAGLLELTTPLGSTAALLEWSAAGAELRVIGEPPRSAPTLDALVQASTTAAVPVAALFDWLDGRPTEAAGWQADLSQRALGRLHARRLYPPADLRLVLEQP